MDRPCQRWESSFKQIFKYYETLIKHLIEGNVQEIKRRLFVREVNANTSSAPLRKRFTVVIQNLVTQLVNRLRQRL